MLALLVAAAGLVCSPTASPRPALALASARRAAAAVRLMAEGAPEEASSSAEAKEAWPEPAFSVAEYQAKEAAAKEAAEAAALASPKPFIEEGGGFSIVAFSTVMVFVAGAYIFIQGVSGGGIARFADDQPPEVQACIKQATTRGEASACLPPVPVE